MRFSSESPHLGRLDVRPSRQEGETVFLSGTFSNARRLMGQTTQLVPK